LEFIMSLYDDGLLDDGVLNDTPPFTSAPPDASGGTGSFLPNLLDTLTNGINAYASVALNQSVARSLGGGVASVNADGTVTYRGAPANTVGRSASVATQTFFQKYGAVAILAGVAVLAIVVIKKA
jgi:hypothetical protein